MFVLIACLLGQFAPHTAEEVTLEKFIERSVEQQKNAIDASIARGEETIKKNRGNGKLLATLKKQLATLKTEKKNPPPAPPIELDFENLPLGTVGAAKAHTVDGHTVIKLRVLQTPANGLLLCTYGDSIVAVMGVPTEKVVDDDRITLNGIWKVNGTLTYKTPIGTTKKVPTITPWEHTDEYEKVSKSPEVAKPKPKK